MLYDAITNWTWYTPPAPTVNLVRNYLLAYGMDSLKALFASNKDKKMNDEDDGDGTGNDIINYNNYDDINADKVMETINLCK